MPLDGAETKGLRDADEKERGDATPAPPAPTELAPPAQDPTRSEPIRSEDDQTDKHNG